MLGSCESATCALATVTPGSFTVSRTRSITDARVSPGKLRKFTFALALVGNAFSAKPPWIMVTAVEVLKLPAVAGSLRLVMTTNGWKSHRFARKIRLEKGIYGAMVVY